MNQYLLKIFDQIKQIKPELSSLIDIYIDNYQKLEFSSFVCQQITKIFQQIPLDHVAFAIELAYLLQTAILSQNLSPTYPTKKIACYLIGLKFSINYLNEFDQKNQNLYNTYLAQYAVEKYIFFQENKRLLSQNTSQKEELLGIGNFIINEYFNQYNKQELHKNMKEAIELTELALPLIVPTHILLTKGGDDRIELLRPTNLNKYHVSSFPETDLIIRSSCTSSPVTFDAFKKAESLRQTLIISALNQELLQTFAQKTDDFRQKLLKCFQLNQKEISIFFASSGTDAEILITYFALCRQQEKITTKKVKCPSVHNILVAADEVGGGTINASRACYFAQVTPKGNYVKIGDLMEGFEDQEIQITTFPTRNSHTGIVVEIEIIEQQLEQLIDDSIINKGQIVILHKVNSSKTGVKVPSFAFLNRLKLKYQDHLILVIDAAQMRCSISTVSEYLKAGFLVLSTGSKFFSGQPFSSMIFVPNQEISFHNLHPGLKGLGDYFTQYDIDNSFPNLKQSLPIRQNYGLILRLETALNNIEQYVNIPTEKANYIIAQWVEKAEELVKTTAYLKLFKDQLMEVDRLTDRHGGYNTIISFSLHPLSEENDQISKPLAPQSLKTIYQWMTKDISVHLPNYASKEEYNIAKFKCLIGQPVDVGRGMGVLRIALSSPMICRMAQGDNINAIDDSLSELSQKNQVVFTSKLLTNVNRENSFSNKRKNETNLPQKVYPNLTFSIKKELEDDKRVLAKLSLICQYYFYLKTLKINE